ncbi:MAG: disulfide bond formation protein B [Patescibacteria group bacterium]
MTFTEIVNLVLSVMTIVGQIFVLAGFFCLISGQGKWFLNFLNQHVLAMSFVVALVATLGSLTYSDLIGYNPCKLCWFQRIAMYPSVILLGMAIHRKSREIIDYILTLSVVGAIIAGYHYLMQIGVAPALPCSAVGYSASCSERFVMEFGYITIPMMALTAFLMIIILILVAKKVDKRDH